MKCENFSILNSASILIKTVTNPHIINELKLVYMLNFNRFNFFENINWQYVAIFVKSHR